VGNAGAGILAITDGGHVTNQLGYVGYSADSTGTVTVDGPGSSWTNSSELYVGNVGAGVMNVTNGGQVSNTGDAYLGAFGGSSGSVTVDGPGSAWIVSDYYQDEAAGLYLGFSGTGSLSVTNGGVVNASQAMNGINVGTFGSIGGDGMLIGNVTNAGYVFPGASLGTLHVEGDYTQSSSGALVIFLDLFLPVGENPRLEVTGDVALDGTLQMSLSGMGRFRGTRSFDVLDWGSLNGTEFSALQLPTFGGAFTWDASQLYTSGVLTLTGPPLEGDFNFDGIVDAADYVVWRKGLETNYTPEHYNIWRAYFGQTAGGAGASANAAVPETATTVMLIVGIFAMFSTNPRKHHKLIRR
jgi:T5SS/PEP-CTERM-associated repeat protein